MFRVTSCQHSVPIVGLKKKKNIELKVTVRVSTLRRPFYEFLFHGGGGDFQSQLLAWVNYVDVNRIADVGVVFLLWCTHSWNVKPKLTSRGRQTTMLDL